MRAVLVRVSLIALSAIVSQADTLALRNGETVTGSWLGVDGDQIAFLVGDHAVKYPRSSVAEVRSAMIYRRLPRRPTNRSKLHRLPRRPKFPRLRSRLSRLRRLRRQRPRNTTHTM